MNNSLRKFIKENNLQPGDVIVAKKREYRVLDHFIVYLGCDYHSHWFMANSKEEGIRRYNEEEVLELVKTFDPIHIRRFPETEESRESAIQRALSQEGQPYFLFGSNCEHFANYVQREKKESPQVSFWVFAVVTAFLIGMTSFENN